MKKKEDKNGEKRPKKMKIIMPYLPLSKKNI